MVSTGRKKGLRAVGKFNEAIFDVEGHRVLANRVNDQSATTYGLGYLREPTISKGGRQLKRWLVAGIDNELSTNGGNRCDHPVRVDDRSFSRIF